MKPYFNDFLNRAAAETGRPLEELAKAWEQMERWRKDMADTQTAKERVLAVYPDMEVLRVVSMEDFGGVPHYEVFPDRSDDSEAIGIGTTAKFALEDAASRLPASPVAIIPQVEEATQTAVERDFWFKKARPIINAIGEISVQEAMDAIEREYLR